MLVMLTHPHTLVVPKFAAVVSNRSSSKDWEVPLLRTQCGLSTWARLPNSTSTRVAWARATPMNDHRKLALCREAVELQSPKFEFYQKRRANYMHCTLVGCVKHFALLITSGTYLWYEPPNQH